MSALVRATATIICDHFDEILGFLAPACERSGGRYNAAGILKGIAAHDMQLWLSIGEDAKIEAIAVSELVNYQLRRVCRVFIVTGEDKDAWIGHARLIAQWAKANGCRGMEAIARPGWRKTMHGMGWKHTHDYLELALDEDDAL